MDDYELILTSALRYAIGRRTYIVDVVTKYITKELPNLSKMCLDCILRDIDREGEEPFGRGYGDHCDKIEWLQLRADALKEREKRFGPYTPQ